ncbi:MAG TPA: helix-turn-helix domain-containing protein [Ktedonobacterales bacterium]
MKNRANPSASMPQPTRADARRNRERLLAVAQAAFAEHGPNASLEDIARRAGVGIGTLYRHFPTRQALLEAAYHDQMELLTAEAKTLLEEASPGDALDTWLQSLLVHKLLQRGLTEVLVEGEKSGEISPAKARMRAAGAALLARAQQAGAVRSDIDILDLMRLVHGVAVSSEMSPARAQLTSHYLKIMIDGLRTSPE